MEGRWFYRQEGEWVLCFSKTYTLIDWVKADDLFADLTPQMVENQIHELQQRAAKRKKGEAVRSHLAERVGMRYSHKRLHTAAVGVIPSGTIKVSAPKYSCQNGHILMARRQGPHVVYFVRKLILENFRIDVERKVFEETLISLEKVEGENVFIDNSVQIGKDGSVFALESWLPPAGSNMDLITI